MGFPGGSVVKNTPANVGNKMWVQSLGREDPLEKEIATHFTILAWEISWTAEPGGLLSMGCKGIRHDLVTKTIIYILNLKIKLSLFKMKTYYVLI